MLKTRLILYFVLLAGAIILLKMTLSQKSKATDQSPIPVTLVPAPNATDSQIAAPAKKTILLSSHMTVARFDGQKDHKCKGMTTLCPDKCGDSGKLSVFTITKYLKYQKPGEYGDPQQEQFMIMYENTLGKSELTPEDKELVATLKPGDPVLLCWNHNYITDEENGSSYPERSITVLKKLSQEEAENAVQEVPDKK